MPARRQVIFALALCALSVLISAGLFTAAALVPAPPAVLPLVFAVCIGAPMITARELRLVRKRAPLDSHALDRLRAHLDKLPETQHPLGL